MPDQDEFDRIGREWRRVYDRFVSGEQDADVANEDALRILTRVLRRTGGCSVFNDLGDSLEHLAETLASVFDNTARVQAFGAFSVGLDRLACGPGVIDQRLDVIAIRSARALGVQLLSGTFAPNVPGALRSHFGSLVVQNLLCHRVLDAARAHSIGLAFASPQSAHVYHDRKIAELGGHFMRLGRQLAADPTGERIRHLRIVPKQVTAAMLFDEANWAVDVTAGNEDDDVDEVAEPDGGDEEVENSDQVNLFDGLAEPPEAEELTGMSTDDDSTDSFRAPRET